MDQGNEQSMATVGNHSEVVDELKVVAAVSEVVSMVIPAMVGRAATAYDVVQMSLSVAARATAAEAAMARVDF